MKKIGRKIALIGLIIIFFVTGIIPGNFNLGIGGISTVAAATNISSQDGIGYSGSILGNEVVGTAFTGYQAWPSGFTKGSSAFIGGVYDGTNIWMIPYNANELVKVDPETGEMTGYSNWPAGFTKGSNAFAGGVYDGTNIWLIPYSANQLIKVNATTGVMTGYSSWPGGSKGSDQFIGGAFDGTNIWLAPYSGSRLIKVDATTGAMTSYNSWPSGTILGSYPFYGSIFDGTSIWFIPNNADRLIKVDPETGDMTGYNNWPSGFTKSASAFSGGVFDETNIWMIPYNATHIVKFDTTTGVMTGYNEWPSGFTKGSGSFAGGVYDGTNIWLVPHSANMLVKVNATTGVMTGFNNWPNGFTKQSNAFFGGVYDGENIWMIPFMSDRLMKFGYSTELSGLTLSSGTLSPAFNSATTSYTASVGNEVTSINVSPMTADDGATVTVNGSYVASGQATSVALNVGSNIIMVIVTSGDGNTKTYTVTVTRAIANSIIAPSVASFDKYASATGYADITVHLGLLGNTFQGIEVGGTPVASTAYEVNTAGNEVKLKKEYLATLATGAQSFTFKFSAGNDATLALTLSDSTPSNSTITPSTASFDKYVSSTGYADITVHLGLLGNTFQGIEVGGTPVASTAYEVNTAGNEVKLKKEYLATLATGAQSFTFKFSAGNDATLALTLSDSTPSNSTITPSTASFDKYASATGYADITVHLGLLGNTFQGIEVGGTPVASTAYEVNTAGNEVKLKKEYLATLVTGTHSFAFKFSAGNDATLTIIVSDSTPGNSTITPSSASFDKYASATGYADITVQLDLQGNTFQGIEAGGTPISATAYDVSASGDEITLKKEYLATLVTGTHSFDFKFSAGNDATLTLTVSDSTPGNSTITPNIASFDKYASSTGYADITVQLDLQGNTFQGIEAGGTPISATAYDVSAAGDEITLKKEYLATLVTGTHSFAFKFSAGNDATLTIIVSDSTPGNSMITPNTASFDKYVSSTGYTDITVQLDLHGNTFQGIELGGTPISATAFEVNAAGDEVTLKKEYLATLDTGTHSFAFKFSAGNDVVFTITVRNSKPVPITPTESNEQQNQLNITIDGISNLNLLNGTIVKENGKDVLKLRLVPTEMNPYVQQMARGETLRIAINNAMDGILIDIDGNTIDLLIDKGIAFEIATEDGTMIWDAAKVDLDKIKAQLGVTAFNQGVNLTFAIREQSSNSFLQNMPIVGQALSMIVYYEKDDKVASHVESKYYSKRILLIDSSIELNHATAIVILEDGSFVHVPTKIVEKDGKRYAEVYTFVDGTISLISQQQSFVDIQGHWAQAAIEEFASQLILTGKTETTFAPNADVTRAEFTAILGRALGLVSASYQDQFDDLHSDNWAAASIQSALNRSLIQGYEDESFRPNQSMTREEAIVVIARAMQMVGVEVTLSDDKVQQILGQYDDADKVSGWAENAVAMAIEAGLLQGKTTHTLASQDSITRAEIVIIIRRMLEYANLI